MNNSILGFVTAILILTNSSIYAQAPPPTRQLKASTDQRHTTTDTNEHTKTATALADQLRLKANMTDVSSLSANINTRTAFLSIAALRKLHLSATLAPGAVTITDIGRAGTFILDTADTKSTDNEATTLRTSSNLCYKRIIEGSGVNVKWFGAKGDGLNNDKMSIQSAIDWAKSQKSPNGGNLRINVIFPNGSYRINGSGGINITNANGIWLSGGDGKYLTTQINGNCGDAIFDFTGSTMSGCSGFTFVSNKAELNPASIGVIFALSQDKQGNQLGGLNCSIKDCYFQLDNNPSFNGGFGTIGILNIRSEEFKIDGCLIKANTGIILSYDNSIKTKSANHTFKSNYANIAFKGPGSMGVIDITGTSIHNYEKIQHAIVLNGSNGISFSGYLYGGAGKNGNEDAAIGIYKSNLTVSLSGTVEGFPTLIYLGTGAKLYNSQVKYSYANNISIKKPVIYLEDNSLISHTTIGVVFGNGTAEMGNRYFLFTPPVNGGDSPTSASINQSIFNLPDWYDNSKVASASLLKQATGVCQFNTGQPFTIDSYWTTDNKKYPKPLGTVGEKKPFSILRFLAADKSTKTTNNGGIYVIKVKGTIRVGDYSSLNPYATNFESTVTIVQDAQGKRTVSPSTTVINSRSQESTLISKANELTIDVAFTDNIGSVRISMDSSGMEKGAPITFLGSVSILSDFLVNSSPIFE